MIVAGVVRFPKGARQRGVDGMVQLQAGQCGLCGHFGEHHTSEELVKIVLHSEAEEVLVDECGHPRHASLHLKVSAISGCDGFIPAAAA